MEIGGQATPLTGDLLRDDRYAVDFGPGVLVGYGGCNRFSAKYSRTGDALHLTPSGRTQGACSEPIMTLERRLFEILSTPLQMSFPDRGTLVLTAANGAVRLRRNDTEEN